MKRSAVVSHSCILCGCKKAKPDEKCSYFSFPKAESVQKQWREKCRLPEGINVSSSRLCSKHFRDEDYSNISEDYSDVSASDDYSNVSAVTKRMRLKKDAVPSIFFIDSASSSSDQATPEGPLTSGTHKSSELGQYCMVCKRRTVKSTRRLPKNETEAEKWINFFNLAAEDIVGKNVRVCEEHFEKTNSGDVKIHHKGLGVGLKEVSKGDNCAVQADEEHFSATQSLESHDCAVQANEEVQLLEEQFAMSSTLPNTPTSYRKTGSRVKDSGHLAFPRYPNDIRTPHLSTPRRARYSLQLTRNVIEKQKKKLKLANQELRRAKAKIANLSEIISHLQKEALLSVDMKDSLMNDLPPVVAEMAYRKLRSRKERYSRELRKFALTLHFYSPRAYDFVRKKFDFLLPHPAHIRKWCCTSNAKPGFNTEVLQTIQKVHKTTEKEVLCNLVIDEMSIRNKIIMKNGRSYGFVDLGFGQDEVSNEEENKGNSDSDVEEKEAQNESVGVQDGVLGAPPTAKKAMVFMLVSLNDSWKCPCAYFLIDTLSSEQLANLIQKCLALVQKYDINVHSLTFDGVSTNFSAARVLGADLDWLSPKFQPYFFHPTTSHKIYIFPDPCHMLKNIRNAFHDYGILIDAKDERISWKYIWDLHHIQSEEGLHLANKLSKRHVNYKQNIMNVRIATQTLSNSTKDSLLYLKNTEKYGQIFKEVTPTATFCKRINDAFDMLNVRSKFRTRFTTHKVPLNAETKEQLKVSAREIIEYILCLKIEVTTKNRRTKVESTKMTPIIKSRRKCGFLGMILCLKNMFDLYDDLQKYGLKYLLTYKVLQDHLENFFCAIRIKGGFNNNPDAFQFRCAYRRLLMHHDVVSSESANCEANDVPILSVSFKKKQETRIFDEDTLVNYELFNFEDLEEIPSEVVYDVVQYIAGFITMKICEKKSVRLCDECLRKLKEGTSSSNLIQIKNRGGLKEPAKKVFDLCFQIEQMIRTNNDKIFLPGFVQSVTSEMLVTHIVHFTDGKSHSDHDKGLIELVASYYLKLRLRHEASILSEVDDYIRRTFTKLILFKNQ